MNLLQIGSRALAPALVGLVTCLLGCRQHVAGVAVTQQKSVVDQPVALQRSPKDVPPSPASEAKVHIVPSEGGGAVRDSLTFCYEDGSAYDPQIRRIRITRVDGERRVYEVAATGKAFLWREWVVGVVPPGFKLVQGDHLATGVYEVYVDAVVGGGTLRVSVDDQGKIRSLPWDKFDRTYGKPCDFAGRTEPRTIPRVDLGKDDLLEIRLKEAGRRESNAPRK